MRSLLILAGLSSALTAAAPAKDQSEGARLLNQQEVIGADDYPLASLEQDQQGTVTIRLKVDRTGVVSSCKVIVSSGHVALDEQSCALYRARARFAPARDSRGHAVEAEFSQRVSWKLEGEPAQPRPRHAWMTRTTLAMGSDGTFVDCKLESAGLAPPPNDCKDLMEVAAKAGAESRGSQIAGFSISENYFYPVDPERSVMPPEIKDASRVARQVTRLVIEADGRISDCKGVNYSGVASTELDVCQLLRYARFTPAPAGSAALVGTLMMTVYMRRHIVT